MSASHSISSGKWEEKGSTEKQIWGLGVDQDGRGLDGLQGLRVW
jgi:hypothetical protein